MDLARLYPDRTGEPRKGDFGRVVVAGGSPVYAGAPALNAMAALRAGADLVYVVAPRRAADLVAGYAPDLITHPCDRSFPEPGAVFEHRPDAIGGGGGGARTPAAHDALRTLVQRAEVPLVVDAEALRAIAERPGLLRGKRAILTPHPGELETLTGRPYPEAQDARQAAVLEAAQAWGATILVKGLVDVISDGRETHLDLEGSPYLTKGGYGDLVAGVAGALLARGASTLDAARAAAWLVGRAGARAAERLGESTLASDALAELPRAVAELRQGAASANKR